MLSIPGTEALSPAVKYVIAFAIIFVLLALFALVLRRLTGGRLSLPASDRGRSRQPRLGIIDVYDLDRQRQLILLRRDNVEHLLLIGGPNDVIVETNIVRTAGARLPPSTIEQADRPEPLVDRSLEVVPRPSVEANQRPEPVVARLGPAEPARAGADHARNGQAAIPPEPMLKPDLVALSAAPAVPPRPAPQPVREIAPQPMREPPVREPQPQYYREPTPLQPVREPPSPAAPHRAAPAKAPPPPREPMPPAEPPLLRAAPEQRPAPTAPRQADATVGDAAVLSNMAKQLEEALKRPMPSGKTASPAMAPNGPAPHDERAPRGMPAPAGRAPQPAPAPAAPAPIPLAPARQPEPQEQAPRPRPAPAPVSRMRSAPEPEPVTARQAASPPQPAPAANEASDPFSVEEIEAEFARLLGRPLDPSERPH